MKIFPKEIIEYSIEHHFWQHSVKSQVLYSTVLVFIIFAIGLSPLLYVDVSVRSSGIIRPESERKMLTSPVSGKISKLNIKENKTYQKGDTLAKFASPQLFEKLKLKRNIQYKFREKISDLKKLNRLDSLNASKGNIKLRRPLYQYQFIALRKELYKQASKIESERSVYERKRYLHKRKILSSAEFDKIKFSLRSAQNQYNIIFNRQINRWQTELDDFTTRLEKLLSEESELRDQMSNYILQMPVTGTFQNVAGLSEGVYVQVNQNLAEISPDAKLIGDVYVSPTDIGLIKKGMIVRMQVDAFDYNQWGTLKGIVTDISKDVIMRENEAFFKVQATLDRTFMQLPNGYEGKLKKGMTLQARFRVARRSLFQLLFDNVDDWLNPKWNEKQEIAQR